MNHENQTTWPLLVTVPIPVAAGTFNATVGRGKKIDDNRVLVELYALPVHADEMGTYRLLISRGAE